ncbi:hypothetical protein VPNG_08409 [Cytospora leucostoma]|uniref:Uncharacterized protein n=1 Tax=Cytospora leucostoma TaxID=1230097 RepID=A0A423W660_9PEZI|nr:hypothetical protein VPNG_08409 [Cytospora leucostoma]
MVDANELNSSASEYKEAEYHLSKIVEMEVPIDQKAQDLFFAEVDRREERRSSCKDLDEGVSINGTTCGPDQVDPTSTQGTATTASRPSDNTVNNDHGVVIRGPLLPTGHLRKLVRIQGKTTEQGAKMIHEKLDRLVGLTESHIKAKKEMPEVHDDIKKMLHEQAACLERLLAYLDGILQLLDVQRTSAKSGGDEVSAENKKINEDALGGGSEGAFDD